MKIRTGNRLLAVREERKLSQLEFAEILDIPVSTYSRIERNETSIDLEKLTSFAQALNVPIQELLPETLAITNNNHNSGQGGGVIFGNQYFYFYGNDNLPDFAKANAELVERIRELEAILLERKS